MVNTVIQVALVQYDEYELWTDTPGPRHETDLQSLEASLFGASLDSVGDETKAALEQCRANAGRVHGADQLPASD